MKYKGFEITVTDQLSGYGWIVHNGDVYAETPQNNGDKIYATEGNAVRAAKAKVNQLIKNGF